MSDVYEFVKEARPLQRIESQREIVLQLAQQTTECGYFLRQYTDDTQFG
jgi:hypothetical protein